MIEAAPNQTTKHSAPFFEAEKEALSSPFFLLNPAALDAPR